MIQRFVPPAALAAFFLLTPEPLPAASAPDEKTDASPPASSASVEQPSRRNEAKTETVKRAPFKIEVSLDGIIEARRSHEVTVVPEAWSEFTVLKAVAHGAGVKRGDALVVFDTERIDEAIEAQERALHLSKIARKQAELDDRILEKTQPLDLAAAKRSAQEAEHDLRRFLESDKAHSVKSAKFSAESAENTLEYEREELRQLQKMYEADDLTEETEEIIMKRQRDTVERATHYLESAKKTRDERLAVSLPRQEIAMKDSRTRQGLALEKSRVLMPLLREKQRLELEKARRSEKEAAVKLADLRRDRRLMTLEAPADGVVYYGRCVRGSWSDPALTASKLGRGAAVQPRDVLMTVVSPEPLLVRAKVAEAQLHAVDEGIRGVAVPTGFPRSKLHVRVQSLSLVPVGKGSFEAELRVTETERAERVMPGMTCKVTLVSYEKKNAILIPTRALSVEGDSEEETDDGSVLVRGKDGVPESREVKLGRRRGSRVEILRGLREGDEVFLETPRGDG